MHCKSLWIKASAKCINVNVNVNIFVRACFFSLDLNQPVNSQTTRNPPRTINGLNHSLRTTGTDLQQRKWDWRAGNMKCQSIQSITKAASHISHNTHFSMCQRMSSEHHRVWTALLLYWEWWYTLYKGSHFTNRLPLLLHCCNHYTCVKCQANGSVEKHYDIIH